MEEEEPTLSNSSIITCLAWVPRGAAKETPDTVQVDEEQIKSLLQKSEKLKKKVSKSGESATGSSDVTASDVAMEADDELAEYDLDHYDSPDEEESDYVGHDTVSNLAMYASNSEDPYITLQEDEEDRADRDDMTIKPTDNLIVAGRMEKDVSSLEVYVYNQDEGNLYVHHDILLPSFPLAAEWMSFNPGSSSTGNFVAIGYMTPAIDVWNLDVIDCLEPAFTLGKKVKKSKKKAAKPANGHTDSVLDIAWNRHVPYALATASADTTIGLWDMNQKKVVSSLPHHTDKVQTLAWHPFEGQSLASGSFDMSVKVFDCRSPKDSFKSWTLDGEIERVIWNQFQPFHLLASTDKGFVNCMDVRMEKSIFTLKAHGSAVTALSLSTEVPSCLVTASSDYEYKIWDIKDNKPSLIVSKDPKMGSINCAHCNPNSPFIFGLGGERDGLRLVDITSHAPVHRHFSKRQRMQPTPSTTSETDQSSSTQQASTSHSTDVTMETSEAVPDISSKKKKNKKKQLQT
ncbi:periodic tryptophan protein 1 homolog [Asterias amurensis]|uniref:periodic tryptophan protein 1 homolog n=1 Tax=Asterias amurensis TaxID=7602 RepID=UPI003AB2334D